MNLELMALCWLRFELRCPIAIRERCPRYMCGVPDVLGVTKSRYLIEIEIKRSLSDFRADKKKFHRVHRDAFLKQQPRQCYFLVANDLAKKIQNEVPAWAGLLMADGDVQVVKAAPVNNLSQKLTIKECIHLVHLMANHIISVERTADIHLKRQLLEHYPHYWNYEI